MAINILKEENRRDKRYPRTAQFYEEKAGWMECSTEYVKKIDDICRLLDIGNMAWSIVLREKERYVDVNEAKDMLIALLAERVQEILATYPYPLDIIKHAMPVKLKDETKEICEDNVENMFIIGVHSQQIFDMCKVLREQEAHN